MPPPHKIRRERKRFLILNFLKKPDFTRLARFNKSVRDTEKQKFQQTVHVETVVLLSQQKPDDTIEIDLDLDELDLTAAERR